MKKVLIFGAIIVVIFASIAIITNMQNASKTEDNPYGKEDLEQSTIDLLDDPNYANQILPNELDERISSGEPTTVYFFSPECQYCLETTPKLAPLAEDMDVDMVQMNLIEFKDQWNKYSIQSTPTLIHFEDGEAVDGIVGAASESEYEEFFARNVGNE
ncbi:thioredoxin family protein [Jeotgalibacillus campisalis]|uniref:Thioredoxin n=1 Tax=Jeotgalibacillus campisalis TaxID=220754 RepID=A0A0C2R929_9BACL|nr:thioredoxin family protein [Jeotgalibacillus campisalis]KIL46825.1 thioredoxin [Jeotgalibacillus campisalis]